jgi:salicylate hydroxylase
MTSTPPKLRVAIAGAGIAGLTAAISLSQHPLIDVHIYERASSLREIGASIALGPNGMRTLDRLGIANALDDAVAFRNTKSRCPMIYRHYKTNEVVSVDRHVGEVDDRHLTARFYRVHLQQALLAHVDPERIHLKKAFSSVVFDDAAQELIINFQDGSAAKADILLGADGINSGVRNFFLPDSRAEPTGWIAFRSVFPLSLVAHIPDLPDEATHFWGMDRTLFVSQLGRDLFTVVASDYFDPADPTSPYAGSTWDSAADAAAVRALYTNWSPLARTILAAAPEYRAYPNVSGPIVDTWTLGNGRVALAGDAAHAHGGAFAAGGSLAIDDAWAFGQAVKRIMPDDAGEVPGTEQIAKALRLYERARKSHPDRVQRTVQEVNRKGKERLGVVETDEELRARMKGRGKTAWIHEHDVVAAFSEAVADTRDSGRQEAVVS